MTIRSKVLNCKEVGGGGGGVEKPFQPLSVSATCNYMTRKNCGLSCFHSLLYISLIRYTFLSMLLLLNEAHVSSVEGRAGMWVAAVHMSGYSHLSIAGWGMSHLNARPVTEQLAFTLWSPNLILYNWLIWRVLKLAFFFKKVFSLYLFWRLEQSEQRHLYVDIFLCDL